MILLLNEVKKPTVVWSIHGRRRFMQRAGCVLPPDLPPLSWEYGSETSAAFPPGLSKFRGTSSLSHSLHCPVLGASQSWVDKAAGWAEQTLTAWPALGWRSLKIRSVLVFPPLRHFINSHFLHDRTEDQVCRLPPPTARPRLAREASTSSVPAHTGQLPAGFYPSRDSEARGPPHGLDLHVCPQVPSDCPRAVSSTAILLPNLLSSDSHYDRLDCGPQTHSLEP